jgi:hypothetical protein
VLISYKNSAWLILATIAFWMELGIIEYQMNMNTTNIGANWS